MPIVTSEITRILPQANGTSLVWESHTDHRGISYEFSYTAAAGVDPQMVLADRAAAVGAEVDAREQAEQIANNFALPLSPYQFLNRLTATERIAARTLAKTDPVVEDILFMVQNAQAVYLTDSATIQGIGYLQMVGVLTADRAGEILNG